MEMLRKGWNWKPSLLRWEEHVWERHLNAVLWACQVKVCINLESNVAKGMAAAAAPCGAVLGSLLLRYSKEGHPLQGLFVSR